tara:strand:+ start:2351 stop:2977 length:627 start_codon:yes stop_codon:yes gene_type:complete
LISSFKEYIPQVVYKAIGMKKHNFNKNTHIQGYYIPTKVCDDLLNLFKKSKNRQIEGHTGHGINKKYKDSTDVVVGFGDTGLDTYTPYLQKCLEQYEKTYLGLDSVGKYVPYAESINIQYYKPGGGFKEWHFERHSMFPKRLLVFMTYLNDVPDGGTEFLYQKITSPAKKGLTLIWPAEFTHTHRGQISKHEKYIITGWYNYINENKK